MLLPRYFKFIGLLFAIPSLVIGVLFQSVRYVIPFLNYHGGRSGNPFAAAGQNNLTDELVTSTLILGLFFIGFSQQKTENNETADLRLKALFEAVLIEGFSASLLMIIFNSELFRFAFIQRYDSIVLNIIINDSLFAILIIFLLRFYYLLYGTKKRSGFNYISFRPLILIARAIALILLIYMVAVLLGMGEIKEVNYAVFLFLPAILVCAWSGGKVESKAIGNLRLKAMFLSSVFNYSIFIILTWTVFGINYMAVQGIGVVSVPFVSIPIFYWLKYRESKEMASTTLTV